MNSQLSPIQKRALAAMAVVWLIIGLLGLRLWYLQVVKGAYYRDLSENNRTRIIRTASPRGYIYDRENRVVVRNRPAFNIAVMREDAPNADIGPILTNLADILDRDVAELKEQLESRKKRRRFEPQIVMADVTREELARIKSRTYNLPGVIVEVLPTRTYPHGALASQVLGYVGEISGTQLKERKGEEYRLGDKFGQAGLEKQWESTLRGTNGYVKVEVDARGNRRSELGIVDNTPGNDLYLSLDLDLQRTAEEALGENRGAVVALDPRNGEILVLASAPRYDLNVFSGRVSGSDWRAILKDPAHPLRNRAISSVYPPGSTFKFVMAAAALAEKKVGSATTFTCPGYYVLGHVFHCHKRSGHGKITLRQAFQMSCNVYFYNVGQLLGAETISRYASMLGLGSALGIDLPGEVGGLVPSPTWLMKSRKTRWYPGDTVSFSIGQSYLSVTPLQMATMVATVANGGKVYRPHLVKRTSHGDSGEVREYRPQLIRELSIDPQVWSLLRSYAVDVVNTKKGTGKRARLDGILVGGKTGTAQAAALDKNVEDHAWFIAFAPAKEPTIALAVVVENSGHGGVVAAPVARQVMETYFRKLGMLPEEEPLEEPSDELSVKQQSDAEETAEAD